MDKSAAAIKKSEKDKAALSEKLNASQLSVLQMFEERKVERAEVEKLQRQNAVLTSLCKELKQRNASNASAGENAAVPAVAEVATEP